MEKYVKHVDLKSVSIGAVLLLSLVGLGLTSGLVWNAYNKNSSAQKLASMNEIADNIIVAAGFEAIERGVCATALSASGPAGPDLTDKINSLRIKGDDAILKALSSARTLADKEPSDTEYAVALRKTFATREALLDARKKVDTSLLKVDRDIQPQEWIKTITDFIESAARLRQVGFATSEPLGRITHDNVILKQAVWLASEYAGRERANIGTMIASQKPIPVDLMKKLTAFRSIVDLNIKEITALKDSKIEDERIIKAIKEMDNTFFNRFEETRKQVYLAAETGQYSITAKEWIDRSTEGINSILAISTALTRHNEEHAAEISKRSWQVLSWFIIQTIGGICISAIAIFTVQKKVGRIWHLYESMNGLSTGQGDLTFRLPADSNDEVGKTAAAFNRFMDQLQNIISRVKQATDRVASASAQLSSTSIQVEKGSNSQAHQATEAANAMEEMKATVTGVAKNASAASNFSRSSTEMAQRGGSVINEAVKGMKNIAQSVEGAAVVIDSLGKSSDQIGEIVSLINDIADQTNLLALNAAIEAARAGEQGRGFAVVADEVRKLAERTGKATAEIAKMIKTIQGDTKKAVVSMKQGTTEVENGVVLVNQAGKSLLQIVDGSQRLSDMIAQIATAAEEQSAVSANVSDSVESIAHIAKENNSAVNQITGASEDLLKLSIDLQKMVGLFKT